MNTATDAIAQAMQRAVDVFTRRPQQGLHDDATAYASWQGGTRVAASHENGTRIDTDMPRELGGSGDRVSPGWLFRAGIAACGATAIAMVAASQGIELEQLDVHVGSRSDARGLLGMRDGAGDPVPPGAIGFTINVRIRASAVDDARLRALVDEGLRRSPMQDAMLRHPPLDVQVQVGAEQAA
ncbi:OsmC family protein [Pseudoxanthomonas daejeonensis]|uniref:Osmotically inducible protein OsmC n=1 Tax=Pseudoxanthomonas daejeonensis TaxID=266062 RepID=A0ABQ6Z8H9_9GAMM|nr:OsmC family protein [Pseudoxanthomonas daejeonensis]KAF1694997.1 osmotically inducible protein OsmC [Pseudoxanthomonas daejeonensis]UNK56233.1 OsmC family protein [Pseudoxanthomonas daejeonensis]